MPIVIIRILFELAIQWSLSKIEIPLFVNEWMYKVKVFGYLTGTISILVLLKLGCFFSLMT